MLECASALCVLQQVRCGVRPATQLEGCTRTSSTREWVASMCTDQVETHLFASTAFTCCHVAPAILSQRTRLCVSADGGGLWVLEDFFGTGTAQAANPWG